MPRAKKTPAKPPAPVHVGRCFHCKTPVTEDEFCHGCKEFVCDDCDQRQYTGRMGPHDKDDHLNGEED